MTAFTIELPEPTNQQLQVYGISQQKLQDLFTNFIQNYLYQHQLLFSETSLDRLTDEDLWHIVHTVLNQVDVAIRKIITTQQRQGDLTTTEEQLLDNYDRAVLVRSKAIALLKKRGHDISPLQQTL
jgi:hypothetical protein